MSVRVIARVSQGSVALMRAAEGDAESFHAVRPQLFGRAFRSVVDPAEDGAGVTEVAERVRFDSGGQIGRAGEQRDVLVARNSSSFSPLMAES